jgi:histidine triad (HIT) family protein
MIYDTNNIFAKIIRGEIPSKKVYEDEFAFAIHDLYPDAPVHVLVLPKGEYVSFDDFSRHASPEFMKGFFEAVQKVALQLGLVENGYRKKYFIRSACALVGIEVMVLTILAIMQPEIFAVYPLHVALLGGLIAGLLMVNVVRTFFSVKKLVDLNKNK